MPSRPHAIVKIECRREDEYTKVDGSRESIQVQSLGW
jgi:hypothetical protein